MKFLLLDSTDKIIYDGRDAKNIFKVLTRDIVNNEDIVRYTKEVKKGDAIQFEWTGKLRYEIRINIKFRGIDDWNRPVFKDIDCGAYFGDVNKLWDYDVKNSEVVNYYKEHLNSLEYFGTKFNCEPQGGISRYVKFNII